MKTYLTSTEFADLFFKFYEQNMDGRFNNEVSDRIVWRMFQEYEKAVKETLEGAMWNIDEYEGENAVDLIGYQFHKSFRQVDVIPAKHIDGIVWACLQEAPMFWKSLKKACRILTSEDAAELYKDGVW